MKRIYKYDLQIEDEQVIKMPYGYQICAIQVQNGIPRVWVIVDDNQAEEDVTFITVGTGHPFKADGLRYLDTYQLDGFVWHVLLKL